MGRFWNTLAYMVTMDCWYTIHIIRFFRSRSHIDTFGIDYMEFLNSRRNMLIYILKEKSFYSHSFSAGCTNSQRNTYSTFGNISKCLHSLLVGLHVYYCHLSHTVNLLDLYTLYLIFIISLSLSYLSYFCSVKLEKLFSVTITQIKDILSYTFLRRKWS